MLKNVGVWRSTTATAGDNVSCCGGVRRCNLHSASQPTPRPGSEHERERDRVCTESAGDRDRCTDTQGDVVEPLQDAFCVGTEPSGLIQACQRARQRPNWYCRLPRRGEGPPNTASLPLYSAWGFVCFVLPFIRWSCPVLLSAWAMALYAAEIPRCRSLWTPSSSVCCF